MSNYLENFLLYIFCHFPYLIFDCKRKFNYVNRMTHFLAPLKHRAGGDENHI